MGIQEDMIKSAIDQMDKGSFEGIDNELIADYDMVLRGVKYEAERELRQKLEGFHHKIVKRRQNRKIIVWTIGIAASFVCVFLLKPRTDSPGLKPMLKMEEVPVFSDSSSYDSLKKMDIDVDEN